MTLDPYQEIEALKRELGGAQETIKRHEATLSAIHNIARPYADTLPELSPESRAWLKVEELSRP